MSSSPDLDPPNIDGDQKSDSNSDSDQIDGLFSNSNIRVTCLLGIIFFIGFYIADMLPAVGTTGIVLNAYIFFATLRNPRFFDGGLCWMMRMISLSCFFYSFYYLSVL